MRDDRLRLEDIQAIMPTMMKGSTARTVMPALILNMMIRAMMLKNNEP